MCFCFAGAGVASQLRIRTLCRGLAAPPNNSNSRHCAQRQQQQQHAKHRERRGGAAASRMGLSTCCLSSLIASHSSDASPRGARSRSSRVGRVKEGESSGTLVALLHPSTAALPNPKRGTLSPSRSPFCYLHYLPINRFGEGAPQSPSTTQRQGAKMRLEKRLCRRALLINGWARVGLCVCGRVRDDCVQ